MVNLRLHAQELILHKAPVDLMLGYLLQQFEVIGLNLFNTGAQTLITLWRFGPSLHKDA